jgi:transposase
MTNYKEILRLLSLGFNRSQIAESMGITRPTVIKVLQRASEIGMSFDSIGTMTDKELSNVLFPPDGSKISYKMPDYDYVHKEMGKSGVTLKLLWFEYCDKCRDSGEVAYQLTQYAKHYRDYVLSKKATMHINRKPGETMEVDWAGQTAAITDTDTGEVIKVNIFVAVLPYSGYSYVEGFLTRDQESWITAHVNAYRFFGGVTRILVPDNLKTGVDKITKDETILNRCYSEMAEHYGTAVIPARVRTPKDKATVEGVVGIISTYILASLRNQQFLSLHELNQAVFEKLNEFNIKPFQKKEGSRALLFEDEKQFLMPLPAKPFELASWKIATVQYNYHISIDGQNYSIPYEYIKQKVDVRITRNMVEIFFEGNRICSHVRLYGRSNQYSTTEAHMPPSHQQYAKWDADRFRAWASKIGESTAVVVEWLLNSRKVPEQSYKSCMALLKLSDKYTANRLELACSMALSYTPHPSFKSVEAILKSGQDKIHDNNFFNNPPTSAEQGFTRGADYYRRGNR